MSKHLLPLHSLLFVSHSRECIWPATRLTPRSLKSFGDSQHGKIPPNLLLIALFTSFYGGTMLSFPVFFSEFCSPYSCADLHLIQPWKSSGTDVNAWQNWRR